ncbi:MAG: right-handed parallel beta-helix repeat-containing protein [Candidatus Cloacimonetes bacterium]|nr:right-handed parallel beta-helix repeat-containing protein [Candidatus Cloacimonadota bacterium]
MIFIIYILCLFASPVLAETYTLSPDGSHSNQKQITEALKNGDVYLNPGIYDVDGPIYITSNRILAGHQDAIIRVYSGSSQWFTGRTGVISSRESLKNVEIAGFQIDGNIGNLPKHYADSRSDTSHDCEKLINLGGYSNDPANNIKIHDMKLYNAFSDGMYIIHAKNVEIFDNLISNCQHEGIYLSVVRDGHMHNNQIAGITSDCARLDNCQNVLVEYNLFFSYGGNSYGAYKGGENGLQIGDAGSSKGYNAVKKGYPTKNIEVRFNTFADPGLRAIWLHGGENVYIHDNEFVDATVLETMGIPIGDISIENQPTVDMSEKIFSNIFDILSMDFVSKASANDTVILPSGIKTSPTKATGAINQFDLEDLSYTLVSVRTEGLSEVRYKIGSKEAVHTRMIGERRGSKLIFTNCSIWAGDFDHVGDSLYLKGIVEPEDVEVTCYTVRSSFEPNFEVVRIEHERGIFDKFVILYLSILGIFLSIPFITIAILFSKKL